MLEVLGRPSDGSPLADRRWTARYAARRIAWHALDHAWEIEDRSEPRLTGHRQPSVPSELPSRSSSATTASMTRR